MSRMKNRHIKQGKISTQAKVVAQVENTANDSWEEQKQKLAADTEDKWSETQKIVAGVVGLGGAVGAVGLGAELYKKCKGKKPGDAKPEVAQKVEKQAQSADEPEVAQKVEKQAQSADEPEVAQKVEKQAQSADEPEVAPKVEKQAQSADEPEVAPKVEKQAQSADEPEVAPKVEKQAQSADEPEVAQKVEKQAQSELLSATTNSAKDLKLDDKDEGEQAQNEKLEGEKQAQNEKLEGEQAQNEKLEGEQAQNEKLEGEKQAQNEKLEGEQAQNEKLEGEKQAQDEVFVLEKPGVAEGIAEEIGDKSVGEAFKAKKAHNLAAPGKTTSQLDANTSQDENGEGEGEGFFNVEESGEVVVSTQNSLGAHGEITYQLEKNTSSDDNKISMTKSLKHNDTNAFLTENGRVKTKCSTSIEESIINVDSSKPLVIESAVAVIPEVAYNGLSTAQLAIKYEDPNNNSFNWDKAAGMVGKLFNAFNVAVTINNTASSVNNYIAEPNQYKAMEVVGNISKLAYLAGKSAVTYQGVEVIEKSAKAGLALKDGNGAYALDNMIGAANKVADYVSFTIATTAITKAVFAVGAGAFGPYVGAGLLAGKIGYDWYSHDTALENNFLNTSYQENLQNGNVAMHDYLFVKGFIPKDGNTYKVLEMLSEYYSAPKTEYDYAADDQYDDSLLIKREDGSSVEVYHFDMTSDN